MGNNSSGTRPVGCTVSSPCSHHRIEPSEWRAKGRCIAFPASRRCMSLSSSPTNCVDCRIQKSGNRCIDVDIRTECVRIPETSRQSWDDRLSSLDCLLVACIRVCRVYWHLKISKHCLLTVLGYFQVPINTIQTTYLFPSLFEHFQFFKNSLYRYQTIKRVLFTGQFPPTMQKGWMLAVHVYVLWQSICMVTYSNVLYNKILSCGSSVSEIAKLSTTQPQRLYQRLSSVFDRGTVNDAIMRTVGTMSKIH